MSKGGIEICPNFLKDAVEREVPMRTENKMREKEYSRQEKSCRMEKISRTYTSYYQIYMVCLSMMKACAKRCLNFLRL